MSDTHNAMDYLIAGTEVSVECEVGIDNTSESDLLKGDEKEVIRSVLNDESLSDEELQEVVREVNDNNVMKLYLCADGQIDGQQLLEQTGGFTSVERGKKTDAIGALLDGKLDIKDLLALITLMSGGQSSQASSQTAGGLLSTLLGGSQSQQQTSSPASLFSQLLGAQPAQQPQAQQQTPSLFSSLFGTQQQSQQTQQNSNEQLNALLQTLMAQQQTLQAQQQSQQALQNAQQQTLQAQQQSQQSQQPQAQTMSGLLGSLFGQIVEAQQQAPQQTQQSQQPQGGLLSQLLSGGQQSQSSSSQMQNSAVLNQPLFTEAPSANTSTGSTVNNQALNQFLGSSPTNSNGTVNVGSMFDLINILMGAKQ